MGEDERVLRLGGLGGLISGVVGIIAAIILVTLVPTVAGPAEAIMRFPENRAALNTFQILNLVAIIVALPLLLALYRALRRTSRASALFGSVLAALGLPILAFSIVPSLILTPFLADLHAEATTDAVRTTLVLLWQTSILIFNTAFLIGVLFLGIAFIVLGVAMLGNEDFGQGFGWLSVVLGVVGVIAISVGQFVDIPLALGAVPFILFLLIMGWKVYSLSRMPSAG